MHITQGWFEYVIAACYFYLHVNGIREENYTKFKFRPVSLTDRE